ncbi:MAG: heme o synthase [Saprospiraceae bacterium]
MKSPTSQISNSTKAGVKTLESTPSKVSDYAQLVKVNLTLIVVLTAVGSFVIASGLSAGWVDIVVLALGGFFVTGASNALNEVLERDFDKIMKRTMNRPVVTGRMSVSEAVLAAGLMCMLGITLLALFNPLCGLLGMIAFVLYAFVYTPLKRYSGAAVFVGAIAGAMPMLIGVVAFTGELTLLALGLFLIQFFWQYPHFWSIAFKGYKDYKKAGFKFIPEGDEEFPARSIGANGVVMSLFLLPSLWLIYLSGFDGVFSMLTLVILTLGYIFASVRFFQKFDSRSALQLLLSSIAYIPAVLLVIIIGMI